MKTRKLRIFLAGCSHKDDDSQKQLYNLHERKLRLLNLEVVKPCDIQQGSELTIFKTETNALFLCEEDWVCDKIATEALKHAAANLYKIYLPNQYNIIVQEYQDKVIN